MTMRKLNIFNKKSSKMMIVISILLMGMFMLSSLTLAQDNARLGKDCPADGLPVLDHDANCSEPDCETRKGCIDAAPASPINKLSSDFGPRNDPINPPRYDKPKGHGAVDFAAPKGAPIYAAADGKISRIDNSNPDGYGNRVQIIHDNGYETLYAHMNCYASYNGQRLKNGQRIKKGTVIGFVGNTGASSGPHLHYEVRVAGTNPANKKDPHGKDMQGVMCKVPDKFAKADVPDVGTSAETSSGESGQAAGCASSGCAKMYPSDNISELHHKYESGGDPCAFNNCLAGDIGGCSYGSSQLACKSNSLKSFLKTLITDNPKIWQQLGGGTVDQMNARACTAPATEFANKWKGVCSSGGSAAFEKEQEKYMQKTYYNTAAEAMKAYGLDFNKMSPELQMSLFSAGVAMGSPGGVRKLMNSVTENVGNPKNMTEEELLAAMYARRDYFYSNSSEAVRKSVQSRNAREGAEALESMKIRKAWEAEQKKPKDQQKSYADIVKEVTGKDACASGKSATFTCSASGVTGGVADGENKAKGYEDKTCAPSEYKSTYGNCMFCPLFEVIFNTASKIAKLSFNKLAAPVMTVVLVTWALWIAMQILTFISSMETKDAPTLIKTLLNKSFVVLIVVILLQSDSSTFFSLAMEPIFNTGFRLAQMAVTDGACPSTYNILEDGGLPASMGTSILCTIEAIQGKLMATMALGAASMCIAFYVKATFFIFPSLAYLIPGLLIFCGAGIVILIFPFLMLDAIFQLTVACALLPAAIGAYPFKKTQGYVKHVWNAFMNAMFNFLFLSIIILILTTAIDVIMKNSGISDITDETFQKTILETLVWGGVAIIKIVFVLLLSWVVLEEASGFASKFAPSMTKGGIGSQIGGMAAGGAKKLGVKAWGGAKTVGSAVGANIKERAGDFHRNLKMKGIENAALNGNGQMTAVTDKDGNVIGQSYEIQSRSWARGRGKSQTVTIMNNGAKMLTETKDYGDGKIVTTKSDGYLKQTETSVNGKVTKSDLTIETAGLKAIRNRDGSMNMTALNSALKGSAFSPEMVKAAAMKQYAEKSFPGAAKFNGPIDDSTISIGTDKEGREVLQISTIDSYGKPQAMQMTMPGEGESNRVLVEIQNIENKGRDKGKMVALATDGMINRRQVFAKDGDASATVSEYSLSQHYSKRTKYAVNHSGQLARVLTENGGTAFGEEDREMMIGQFIDDRTRGKQHTIAGIV